MDADDVIRETTESLRTRRREGAVDQIKHLADGCFADLHPTHKARAYRDLQAHANEQAREQEHKNTENGVPE